MRFLLFEAQSQFLSKVQLNSCLCISACLCRCLFWLCLHTQCLQEVFINIQCMLSGLHGFPRHLLEYCLLLTVATVSSNLSSFSCLPLSRYCTPFMVHSCQQVQAQIWRHVLAFNFQHGRRTFCTRDKYLQIYPHLYLQI